MVRDLANNQAKWGWGSGAEPDTDVHTHVRADLRRPGDACVSRRVDRRRCGRATAGHIRPDSTGGPRPIVHPAATIGPDARDPARRYSGNGLECESCHLDAGTKKFGLPLAGLWGVFPLFIGRENEVRTL